MPRLVPRFEIPPPNDHCIEIIAEDRPRFACPEVFRVLAEPVEMLSGVRTQAFEILCTHRIPLLDQLSYDLSLISDLLKHHGVSDKFVVMNGLLVFRGIVAPQDPLATEQEPLGEPMKCLDFILWRAAGALQLGSPHYCCQEWR
jgi:hypothetical protein